MYVLVGYYGRQYSERLEYYFDTPENLLEEAERLLEEDILENITLYQFQFGEQAEHICRLIVEAKTVVGYTPTGKQSIAEIKASLQPIALIPDPEEIYTCRFCKAYYTESGKCNFCEGNRRKIRDGVLLYHDSGDDN